MGWEDHGVEREGHGVVEREDHGVVEREDHGVVERGGSRGNKRGAGSLLTTCQSFSLVSSLGSAIKSSAICRPPKSAGINALSSSRSSLPLLPWALPLALEVTGAVPSPPVTVAMERPPPKSAGRAATTDGRRGVPESMDIPLKSTRLVSEPMRLTPLAAV